MKKLVLILMVLAVLFAVAVNIFSRKAPEMLREGIERSLNKAVSIQNIEFSFPWNFELTGVKIKDDHGPFSGEVCFSVDRIHLEVSPLSLSQKGLVISRVDIQDASVFVRNRQGRLYHALSDAMKEAPQTTHDASVTSPETDLATLPLTIHQIRMDNSRFEFVDYDAQESGFVIALDNIRASAKDIYLPAQDEKTSYRIEANLPQGRDQKPGEVKLSGWTDFSNYDTDALLSATALHLPYFKPYLSQVTPAEIRDGYLNTRSSLRVDKKKLTANIDFELSGLYFESYEEGEQLFGLKAEEILSFLKEVSGGLRFQFIVQWDLGDTKLRKRDVIRKSIEQSLKKTVLGNVGNLLENTLKKISERGMEGSRDDWEGALKKVKELFR